MSVCLEGTLQKWTNYVSGWQPRWFILEDGVLSYYLSSQEVDQGCRGSVNVTSCDIAAHYKDKKRIDVTIPGERYIYLRMSTEAEKQKWLVALGHAKQNNSGKTEDTPLSASKQAHPSGTNSSSEQARGKIIRSRMLDLHLTCQLLVSHIATLKSSLVTPTEPKNVKSLDELSLLLSTTCDSFLNVLAECMDLTYDDEGAWPSNIKPLARPSEAASTPPLRMKLAPLGHKSSRNASSVSTPLTKTPMFGFSADELYPPQPLSLPATPKVTTPTHRAPKLDLSLPAHLKGRLSSQESKQITQIQEQQQNSEQQALVNIKEARVHDKMTRVESTSATLVHNQQSTSELFMTPTSSPAPSPPPSPSKDHSFSHQIKETSIDTFFSTLPHKFSDLDLLPDSGIPAAPFLQCCRDVLPFFDALSPTVFAPVKAGINGDIEKVAFKHSSAPNQFPTLQSIVLDDLRMGAQDQPDSATTGLLWLKRSMEFVQLLFSELSGSDDEMDVVAVRAYEQSLSRHHNFLVRGLFYLGVKAAPYRKDFLALLSSSDSPDKEAAVLRDTADFARAMGRLTKELNKFYLKHDLETPL